MILSAGQRWFAVPFLLAFFLSVAFSYATYEAPPVPRVNVRWSEQVTQSQRETLEATYHLAEPEYDEGRTWSYEILDTSTGNIRRLVQDSAVEDTHMIDRATFGLADLSRAPALLFVLFRFLALASVIGVVFASGVTLLRHRAGRWWRAFLDDRALNPNRTLAFELFLGVLGATKYLFFITGFVALSLWVINVAAYYYQLDHKRWYPSDEFGEHIVAPQSDEGREILLTHWAGETGQTIYRAFDTNPSFAEHPTLHYIVEPARSDLYTVGLEGIRYFDGWTDEDVQEILRSNRAYVFIMGGSTTFGHGLANNMTMPFALQSRIEDEGWTVFNLGAHAYDQTREIDKLLYLLREGYRPRAVVFLDGLNDIVDTARSNYRSNDKLIFHGYATGRGDQAFGFGRDITARAYGAMLLNSLPVTRLMRDLKAPPIDVDLVKVEKNAFVDRLDMEEAEMLFTNWSEFGERNFPFLRDQLLRSYEQNLDFLQALGEAFDFEVRVFYQPLGILAKGSPWIREAALNTAGYRFFEMMDAAIRAQIENGLRMVDISEVLAALNVKQRAYIDAGHYSPEANDILAQAILDEMLTLQRRP